MIKGLITFFFIVGISFAAEPDTKNTEGGGDTKSQWFFGIGLGAGLESIEASIATPNGDIPRKTNGISATFRGKIGGYHYFSPETRLGLRYYYSLDYNSSSRFVGNPWRQYRAYYTAFIHLINLDVLVRIAEIEEHRFDFIGGVAGGLRFSTANRSNHVYLDGANVRSAHLEGEINIGARWMYQKKYGLELMTRIPLNDITTATKPKPAGNHFFDRLRQYFSMTLDFVVEL